MTPLDTDGMDEWVVEIFDENGDHSEPITSLHNAASWGTAVEFATEQTKFHPEKQLRVVFMKVM